MTSLKVLPNDFSELTDAQAMLAKLRIMIDAADFDMSDGINANNAETLREQARLIWRSASAFDDYVRGRAKLIQNLAE